ncbi:Metallo-dependent phosphatase [Multifurca ochricompacta]|uniref:Metallo-dependent phosphatase n=1 Tax=Multifurca ochricompacta TaxID=376703 RepID=A0AAD4QQK3_9AGAM|nr:Metallo-dependent phosphatase [Multifurca ochricompacta]
MTIRLPILHWNDVYRVRPQKVSPTSSETIDVTQFAGLLDDIRDQWPIRGDGNRDGLSLFSGDVFAPSVDSSVTRGSHMVPVMNTLAPDVSLVGNHDFDFGYPHLCTLIQDTKFPWLLSNIVDTTTSRAPEHLLEFYVLERRGVTIGFIGLVEKEWIGTVPSWPSTFVYQDMAETGRRLSQLLRDPAGQYKCDIIIALSHARRDELINFSNQDIQLAKRLLALTPSSQSSSDIANEHGVDIILGGHDHLYFVGRGVNKWDNYSLSDHVLGAEEDNGDALIVKSGTDFRDLSEIWLELKNAPEGSIRRKLISRATGKRHEISPRMRSCQTLRKVLDNILKSVGASLKAPLCKLSAELDVRSQLIRTTESASADWFADILRHTYDDALCTKGFEGGVDGVFICAGMLRGDSVYGPGFLTLGDVLEILPFEDPLVVLEISGKTLWDALEASLSTWPAQEGRFPVISGFRVSWDSRRPSGQRVLGVWLQEEQADDASIMSNDSGRGRAYPSDDTKPKYKILTREYMAQGHDGFIPFKGNKYLIDDESGQITSTVVRKYLLGSRFISKLARFSESQNHLHEETHRIIQNERARLKKTDSRHNTAVEHWKKSLSSALRWSRSRRHFRDYIHITSKEHMSGVDCFDGAKQRAGKPQGEGGTWNESPTNEGLLVVHPWVDGRLRDEAQE